MAFQIKLYRLPEQNNGLIIIGIGQVEPPPPAAGIPEPDESLYQVLKSVFGMVRRNAAADETFLDAVRKIIVEALKDGTPHLKRVAKIVGIGPRTLERRLDHAGIDFSKLVEDTRRRLAIALLSDSQNRLTDIALVLGYSEVSAFNRAFKRWTNSTPRNFRRTHLRSQLEKANS